LTLTRGYFIKYSPNTLASQISATNTSLRRGLQYLVQKNPTSNRAFVMDHAYWGHEYSDQDRVNYLGASKDRLEELEFEYYKLDQDQLYTKTVSAIMAGGVVEWFQGPMEWGPRALGNRSILGDPRRTNMKDILNLKIKRRESLRPFAPSVIERTCR
jgi:carbamoyltransferase